MNLVEDINKYNYTYSPERLLAYIYSNNDSLDDVIVRYSDNIKISQAFYPELCVLEIILRNSINTMLENYISKTWLDDEMKNNKILDNNDYKMLVSAYEITSKECKSASKQLTSGKIVANLSFGFWTNLCAKKYSSKIWNKKYCFKSVFVNYPGKKPEISVISKKLYTIRKLRNRIFHYEQIFKYPDKTIEIYNTILELLSYLPDDELKIIKNTSTFLKVYNELSVNYSKISHEKTRASVRSRP